VPRVSQAAFAPTSSDVPTFVVEQALDPRLDPGVTAQLRAGLPHLSVLSFATLPGGALPGDFPPCFAALRRQFLTAPFRPLATRDCARMTPPIRFVVPTL
jgi:hypothetical protein